ncbi:MAG: thiamine S protein [Methanolinea sp.]|jgi:sulfur carrier protein ThiS|nr:thiamine S protein [Methanolinea sp.]
MGVKCRFLLEPEGKTIDYEGADGATYEDALLSLGISPDIVLILHEGISLPQDKPIEESEVVIVSTCSRG